MKAKGITLLILMLLLALETEAAKQVLFYEIGTPKGCSMSEDYSTFAKKLTDKGYEVSSITRGKLTRDVMSKYDILVICSGSQVSSDVISAILWFVMQDGKGVLISSVSPETGNKLTIPFGITIDDGVLIDTTDSIPDIKEKTNFIIDRFTDDETVRTVRQGITQLGFYEGNGLIISGNAICVAHGDSDTYSDTLSFTIGSRPCVAVAVIFGKGLVFVISDSNMLDNKYIENFDNLKFGSNVIDWLSISGIEVSPEGDNRTLEIIIGELKLDVTRLESEKEQLKADKKNLNVIVGNLQSQLLSANADIENLKGGKIGPFTPSSLAMIVLGVCILLTAIIISQKKKKGGGAEEIEGEEVLGELGYELEEEAEKPEDDIDTEGLEKI